MSTKVAEVLKSREEAHTKFLALAETDSLTAEQTTEFETLKTQIKGYDAQIQRLREAQELAVKTALPVAGQEARPALETVPATVETDRYVKDKTLIVGAVARMMGAGGGKVSEAKLLASELYGEQHPVSKMFVRRALNSSTGAAGGFIIPPDYMNEIIELLRPRAVIRNAGPRVIPMPRGTMTLPGQASAAVASYNGELTPISSSQQTLNQIIASYKKLTALVPVTNDLMRYADPAADAFVRDDLVKVMALREDLAFFLGDGTANTPRGYLSFAIGYATANGGTAPVYSTVAGTASTLAVGGNFITSTSAFTQTTAANELAGAVNRLDSANVPDIKRRWFFHPRIFNYLNNVLNSQGLYVYRDELSRGTLLGYPFSKSTQLPINYQDASTNTTYSNGSLIFLAEMDETMILDSMQLELAVSRDGTYVDASGNTQSAFTTDQTLIRAIAEHDFQIRHDASVAVIQNVQWAPAIT